jgi:hypothetical protein
MALRWAAIRRAAFDDLDQGVDQLNVVGIRQSMDAPEQRQTVHFAIAIAILFEACRSTIAVVVEPITELGCARVALGPVIVAVDRGLPAIAIVVPCWTIVIVADVIVIARLASERMNSERQEDG